MIYKSAEEEVFNDGEFCLGTMWRMTNADVKEKKFMTIDFFSPPGDVPEPPFPSPPFPGSKVHRRLKRQVCYINLSWTSNFYGMFFFCLFFC